jgi:hypothetical protein
LSQSTCGTSSACSACQWSQAWGWYWHLLCIRSTLAPQTRNEIVHIFGMWCEIYHQYVSLLPTCEHKFSDACRKLAASVHCNGNSQKGQFAIGTISMTRKCRSSRYNHGAAANKLEAARTWDTYFHRYIMITLLPHNRIFVLYKVK